MPTLQKAKLKKIGSDDASSEIEVQFNPESLKIQLSNRVEGGRSQGRQVRQFVGSSSNVFNLDLEFDSADEGTTEDPVSVLEKTQFLEQFIQPKITNGEPEESPEKLRFSWGNLIIEGVVESIDMEFDYFAHNGNPLHAKVSLKMKEQQIEFQLQERQNSANNSQSAQSLGGELPSEMATRLGFDPGAWRGLDLDLSLGLELQAGLEIDFSSDISASLGVDVKAGIEVGIDVSLEASLGLQAGASVTGVTHLGTNAGDSKAVASAVSLARAGGVIRATETVKQVSAEAASNNARESFSRPAVPASGFTVSSAPTGTSVSSNDSSNTVMASATLAGKPSTFIDPRISSFGYGVPIKPQRNPLLNQRRQNVVGGALDSDSEIFSGQQTNPLMPAWERLPSADSSRAYADKIQLQRKPLKRCGCVGRCQHRN